MNRPVLVALLGCALLLGCRSRGGSVPESIEPDRESWISRLPATATVQEYATELARLNSDVPASFDPSDGLSVREAEAVALVFNGELRRARLDARVPLLGARQAGVAEDPRFEFDLLRVLESVSNPWVAISGLKFTVPLSNRLADERIAAFASASAAWRAALVAEAALLTELRSAWISWSATHERIRLLEGHLRAVEEVLLIANSQLKAEQIGATEARVLELEKVSRGGDLVAERMREQQLLLDLKALMGLRPEADVELVPSLGPAAGCAATEHGERQLVESNPELAHAQAEFLAADRAMRLEVSRAVPDMEIGALFESEEEVPWAQRRNSDEFDYGYALTVHKAQGSQWDDVLLFDESYAFKDTFGEQLEGKSKPCIVLLSLKDHRLGICRFKFDFPHINFIAC